MNTLTFRIRYLFFLILGLVGVTNYSWAATINASSCSQSAVKTAINSASNGDTVKVPAGNCSWNGFDISKAIHLKGAGVGQTHISISSNTVTKKAAGVTKITDFSFSNSGGGTSNKGFYIKGSWKGAEPVIFENNDFNISGSGLFRIEVPGGVIIANNSFTGGWDDSFIQPKDDGDSDNSWGTADTMGMRDTSGKLNIYVENNTFYGGTNQGIDCDDSTRCVYRYNTLTYSSFNTHGMSTSPIGVRHFEVYHNTFIHNGGSNQIANQSWAVWIRGGTGVIFNNQIADLAGDHWGNKTEIVLSLRGGEGPRPQGSCSNVRYPVPRQLGQNHNGTSYFTDPIYIWGNTGTQAIGTGWNWGNSCGLNFNEFFKWGRDGVKDGSKKPGYSPYTYPHPLLSGTNTTPPPPPPTYQCSDGQDNDSDGLTDYPADPGCSGNTDNDEFNAPAPIYQCSDGQDNDSDGLTDYPADPGCSSNTDNDEFNAPVPTYQCADGQDNDSDGLTYYPADPGCSSNTDNDEFNAPSGDTPEPLPLPPASTNGSIYYVDKTAGNDNNPGTKARPWKNAPGMNGQSSHTGGHSLSPGDFVYFDRDDTWTVSGGPQGFYLVGGVRYIGDEWEADSGTTGYRAVVRAGNDFNDNGVVRFRDHATLETHFKGFEVDANGMSTNGIDINHGFWSLMNGATKRVENVEVHDVFTEQSKGEYKYGIAMSNWGGSNGILENVEIINCSVHDIGRDAIVLYPSDDPNSKIGNILIRGCEVYNTGQDPNYGEGHGIVIKGWVYDSTIENNYIHDVNSSAIFVSGPDNDGNQRSADNLHVRNNILSTQDNNGIVRFYKKGAKDIKMYGNILYDNSVTGGLNFGGSSGTLDLLVYNNTFYNTFVDLGSHSSSVNSFEFKNNIIQYSSNQLRNAGAIQSQSNNLLVSSNPGFKDPNNKPTGFVGTYGVDFHPNTNGFSLNAGSSAINGGTGLENAYKVSINSVSRPQGSVWDIGAYELSATGVTTLNPPSNLRLVLQ